MAQGEKERYIHTLSSTQFLILELAPPGIFNAIPTLMRSWMLYFFLKWTYCCWWMMGWRERGRLFQNSIEGFFTGIHTLNWVQTKGGSEYPIQKEWVWWRRIHLVYIFESEGVSPFHFNLWQHHHISFYKNRAHKKLFTPLAFDDSMYLVLRLFQFDRLHEEGPQRFFCKFYVNFSDKKDSNEKKKSNFQKGWTFS